MNTIFFWVAWGALSFWALKTFYFSFSKDKLERLRKAALALTFAVFVLTLLPWWLPESLSGGEDFLAEAISGNLLAIVFFLLLTLSLVFLLIKESLLLKAVSLTNIAETFLFFILMSTLRPGTFTLSLFDLAPIAAIMTLLINNVILLLLWQQLELQEKKSKKPKVQKSPKVFIVIIIVVLFVGIGWFVSQKTPVSDPGQKGIELVSNQTEVKEFKKAVQENGRSKFAVEIAKEPTKPQEAAAYEPFYLIQVFETFPDHRTTFGWYRYYPETKELWRNNIVKDVWERVEY